MTMTMTTEALRRALAGGLLVVLLVAASATADECEDPSAGRRIRAEPTLARRALALPYDAVTVLAWPVKKLVIFMEAVNLPARIGDAARAPFGGLEDDG